MPEAPSQAPTPDLSGRRLGNYQLLRQLGRGGMADVYLANELSLGRQVAFKVLRPELATDETHVQRFVQEARATAHLTHPNIVQVFDVGRRDGVLYIAQEYVAGKNLKQQLVQSGPLPIGMVVNVMRQTALALHKAAEIGVIHRDIKPENVLLGESGQVKVADFGLVRAIADPEAVRKTQPGMVVGTPLYMSPEQIEDGDVDHRSDLYSLGVTCFHLLAGRPPFDGDTPLALALQHMQHPPPTLTTIRQDVPDSLWRIIRQLMEKDPARRFANAGELLKQLRAAELPGAVVDDDWAVHELVSQTEARTHVSGQLQEAMRRDTRRRRVGVWSGLALIVGIALAIPLGAGLAYWMRPAPLLSAADNRSPAETFETIQEQYTHGVVVGTEDALRAVWTAHQPANPGEQYLVNKAKRRLAMLYLSEGRAAEAKPLFDELAGLAETETEFRVFGQLGQALLLWQDGDKDAAVRPINDALEALSQMKPVERAALLQTLEPQLRRGVQERLQDYLQGRKK